MKKIFTLVMLSIFTVMYANATEETLWEGDWMVSWTLPDGDAHKEWGAWNEDASLNQDIVYHFQAGTKINIYLKINEMKDGDAVYHKVQFDNWEWTALPGLEPAEFTEDKVFTIDVTEALAAGLTKGFRLHGHGFNVVKVTKGDIEGGETAINSVAANTKNDNRYYNLAGQVVAQPTKGLYIVNGKKVIVK